MIKIDMEMPDACRNCPCLSPWIGQFELEYNCGVNHKKLRSVNNRQNWCPLIECEDENI